MKNQNLLDQFFLRNTAVVEQMVQELHLAKSDTVLEIGAGTGILTRRLAEAAGQIIAVEIDKKFQEELKKIQGSVKLIFKDALKVIKEGRIKFNKIVGSLPSSIVEPLMHILTKPDFKLAVFLLPLKFAYKLMNSEVFAAYFDSRIVGKVVKNSFSPVPRTSWAIVKMVKKPSALSTKDIDRFLTQYVYEHPKTKPSNSSAEGLIKFYRHFGKKLTKNEARRLASSKNPPAFLEKSGGF